MIRTSVLKRADYVPITGCIRWTIGTHRYLSLSTARRDGLRILFCGADEFSIHSLKALHDLQTAKPDSIESIEVVCRPDKRVGHGLKRIREVPIKSAAQSLSLRLHQLDTFRGWTPPSPIDLVVAVSFGLLVPARVLAATRHGGLNVHPSLLPDLRGPAPVHHALLAERPHTGVSVQTMHPTRFDHGCVIAQTPAPPGILIARDCAFEDLLERLGVAGAQMLRAVVESGAFRDPKPVVANEIPAADAEKYIHAGKITPEDRHIDWLSWSAKKILLRDRVLGRLWDATTLQRCSDSNSDTAKRVVFHGPWREVEVAGEESSLQAGWPVRFPGVREKDSPTVVFPTIDGKFVAPESATIDSEGKGKGLPKLARLLNERKGGRAG